MCRDVNTMYIDNDIINEISQECLNTDQLVGHLTLSLSKKIKSTSGHVHIHFRNKSDHIVIVWSNGRLREIGAKSAGCKKGQFVKWEISQFCDYKGQEVLEKLYDKIESMEIDGEEFNKIWLSYNEFIRWLVENRSFI